MSQQKIAPTYSAKDEQSLMTELWDAQLADDLEKFVMFVYPWGKPGTPLERFKEPRSWQRDELQALTEHIRNQKVNMARGIPPEMYRSSTASGRGIGKSAITSWLDHWMMTTRLGSTCITTANTETQLKSRTWAELGKWHTLSINAHWFERTALSLKPADWFKSLVEKQLKIDTGYYYAQAQLWSEENPDAFAGIHNHNGVMLIFDEASGIPAPIWSVSEGFFTEPVLDRYWFCFGNPRRNTGEFYETFHRFRDYWQRRNVDSRTVEGTDQKVLNDIVQKYGEDSDEARKEVKGQFPRQGDKQFISRDVIEAAIHRETVQDPHAALIMGVDPARYGDDSTVIYFRQGRDGRSIPHIKMKGADNMAVANKCAELINQYNPDAVCIDAGNGTGIIDRLRELKYKVHEVWFGSKPTEPEWADKRTEMWAAVREWLGGGCIPDDRDLADDLAGPEYDFVGAGDKIKLESKDHMKTKRQLASPDTADALACTFAVKVARRDSRTSNHRKPVRQARDVDYSIF